MKQSMRSYILNFIIILGFTAAVLWFALKDNFHSIMELIGNIPFYGLLSFLVGGSSMPG